MKLLTLDHTQIINVQLRWKQICNFWTIFPQTVTVAIAQLARQAEFQVQIPRQVCSWAVMYVVGMSEAERLT